LEGVKRTDAWRHLENFVSTVIIVNGVSKKNYPSKVGILSIINFQANSYTFTRFSDTYDEFRGPCIMTYSYNKTNEMR